MLAATRGELGLEAVDLLLEIVDEAEGGGVEGALVVRERLDVPAHQLSQDGLDRTPESPSHAGSKSQGAVGRDRPEALRLRPSGPAVALVSGRSSRVGAAAPDLLLELPEEFLDIDGNRCRFAILGVVERHRGILAGGPAGALAHAPDEPPRMLSVRVGISLLTLAPGDLGGAETYARGLLRALASVGTQDYTVLVPAAARDAAGGLRAVEVKEPPVARRGPSRIPAMALAALRSKEVTARRQTFDVVHYPLTVEIPRVKAPAVVTLHDVQHRDLPDFFGPGRRSFRRIAYDRAAKSAAAVVVTSEFVRDRAADLLELDRSRLHVVPLGIDHDVFRTGDDEREPFILYPARPWPHKNHARLLEAFAALRATRPQLRLVLTGGGLDRLDPLPDGVARLGVVSPERLASLYRRAACLAFPSLYEGFGLPPLEAMACGCPVAASRAGAIPEVCGDAAVLFDPEDPGSIAAAILEADEREDELREKGLARSAEFTWEETARRHETVYEAVAASSTRVHAGTPTTP